MSKRKVNFQENDEYISKAAKKESRKSGKKMHSLDSDEEDEDDEATQHLDADDIEGEEEGVSRQIEGQRMTAFNMKEEMEEGYFDKSGHFIWNNEREIRDNWLDNVEWHKINNESKYNLDPEDKGLGASSDSDEEEEVFDEICLYKKILKFMKPKETINKTIRRLGSEVMKLSSIERLKRKKAGTLNSNQDVADLTELANRILTKTGNMNVYQESFEDISKKIDRKEVEPILDMYADDFGDKEKGKITGEANQLKWEFKWEQEGSDIQGPFDTNQMIKWANEGYFKTGVWARKCGEQSNFYNSNRIDFELYE